MTRFIDTLCIQRIIEKKGLTQFLSGLTEQLEHDYCEWESFDKCARVPSHSDIGVIELMPVANTEKYAFKFVNGHPANTFKGLSTVMAFGALAEVETGMPTLLSELTITTAFRTAATSVMAAKALARKNVKRMAMIGCGAQSEFQCIAFHTLLGITEIQIFDIDLDAMNKLAEHLVAYPNLQIIKVNSPQDACKNVDIITTCTADKKNADILTPDMVSSGVHINAIGGDCPGKTELHPDILNMTKTFVEYEPQTRVEGEIQQMPEDYPTHDLWRVITGEIRGRESDSQITLFDSVGFALEDYSALCHLENTAKALDEGEMIDLIPALENPKNLFGLLAPSNTLSALSTSNK
ncbi:MAG: ornithine cyclodeaminase [Cellvibrionales bacterium]|nr:ornithine cyclodeaminase [Cellvibrionales bacterium]